MKDNNLVEDGAIYISTQKPNLTVIIIGLYHSNNYAGFLAIPYGSESMAKFGLQNGTYYYRLIES